LSGLLTVLIVCTLDVMFIDFHLSYGSGCLEDLETTLQVGCVLDTASVSLSGVMNWGIGWSLEASVWILGSKWPVNFQMDCTALEILYQHCRGLCLWGRGY
jgi:hypothetical protein